MSAAQTARKQRQNALIQKINDLVLPVGNPIPITTALAVEFEADTVDTEPLATLEVQLMTFGQAMVNEFQGEENRRAADEHAVPYQLPKFAWQPQAGDANERLGALAVGFQQLYNDFQEKSPSPPQPINATEPTA